MVLGEVEAVEVHDFVPCGHEVADEGVRVTTSLEGVDPSEVRVGLRVKPVFAVSEEDDDGERMTLLRHQPA